ncbi:MAG: hypothetical protein ACHQ1H_04675 [Nitrososphaerales archaeon]
MTVQMDDDAFSGRKKREDYVEEINNSLETFSLWLKAWHSISDRNTDLQKASEDPRATLGFLPEFLHIDRDYCINEVLAEIKQNLEKRQGLENRLHASRNDSEKLAFFCLPYVEFVSQGGADCLRFSGDLSGVLSYTIHSREFVEDFSYGSWSSEIKWKKEELGVGRRVFFLKESKGLGKLTLPLNLLKGLTEGVPLSKLAKVSMISERDVNCTIENFAETLTLRVSFCNYLAGWKTKGGFQGFLQQYLQHRAVNSLIVDHVLERLSQARAQEPPASTSSVNSSINSTVKRVNATVSAPVNAAVSTNRLSSSDLRRLKQAIENPGPFTYGKWALLLQFDTGAPQSAFAWLHRMEREGFIKLIKSQDGVTVSAKHVALEALKLFHVTPS